MQSSKLPVRRVLVVIDSTEFFQDVHLRRNPLRRLGERVKRSAITVVIPEVVVLETIRHARTQSENSERKVREVRAIASKLMHLESMPVIDFAAVSNEIVRLQADYEARLRTELHARNFEVAPHPSVTHARLVEWTIYDRQPFDSKGRGYRDALVWATLLERLERLERLDGSVERTVFLVSRNSADFADVDGNLGPTLVADALAAGEEVVLVPDVDALLVRLDDIFAVADEESDSEPIAEVVELQHELFEARDQGDDGDEDLLADPEHVLQPDLIRAAENLIGTEIDPLRWERDSLFSDIDIAAEIEDARIEEVNADLRDVQFTLSETLEDGVQVGEALIGAEMRIEGYVAKTDLEMLKPDVRVLDRDWNDQYALVSLSIEVILTFESRVDLLNEKVQHLELLFVSHG